MLSADHVVAQQRSGPPIQPSVSQQHQLPKLMATAQKTFEIPFSVNATENKTVEVILQLSVDRGKTWRAYSRRAANTKSFPFSTPQDGEFWFAIQTVDRNGAKSPVDQRLKPELRIAVDTVKPTFEFSVRPDAAGRVVGNWVATDPNIDTCSMKIEYQSQGGQWISVPTNACRKAQHSTFRDELAWWPDTAAQVLQVRATIKDAAGNANQVTRNVTLPLTATRRAQNGMVAKRQPIMTNYQRSRLPVALAHLYGDSPDPKVATGGTSPVQQPRQARQVPMTGGQSPASNDGTRSANPQRQQTVSPRSSQMVRPQPPRSANRFASNKVGPASTAVPATNSGSKTWDSQSNGVPSGPVQVQMASTQQKMKDAAVTVPADPAAAPNAQWRRRTQAEDSAPRVAQRRQQSNQTVAVGSTSRFPRAGEQQPMNQQQQVQHSAPFRSVAQPLPGNSTLAQSASAVPHSNGQLQPQGQDRLQGQPQSPVTQQPLSTAAAPQGSALNAQWSSSTTGEVKRPPQPATTLASGPLMESLRKKARPSAARRFQMEYDIDAIGPDGVKEVQLWMTSDGGNNWRKHSIDADQRSPLTAEVTADGIYGFRILVVSNDGLRARAPKRGDPADMWVNVDTNLPMAKITGVPYGRGNQAGKLLVQWQASDANISMRPVRLQYSSGPQGPWTTIEDGVRNEGQYAWKPAANIPDQVYLRIQVRDIAGNIKTETMNRPVDISGLIPRGRIRGLTPLVEPTQDATT